MTPYPGAASDADAVTTWILELSAKGIFPTDDTIAQGCRAVLGAKSEAEAAQVGAKLTAQISDEIGDASASAVGAAARRWFGDALSTELGEGTREDRAHRLRGWSFRGGAPWLGQVWLRDEAGEVRGRWLIVDRVLDAAHTLDPNPWDDVDEHFDIPVDDFLVLWELSGATSFAVTRAA